MSREQLQALVERIRAVEPALRRELVERAMLIVTGVATWDDIDSFSFDFSNTWGHPKDAGATWANPHRETWNDLAKEKE